MLLKEKTEEEMIEGVGRWPPWIKKVDGECMSVVWQERRIKTSGVGIVESAWMLYSYSIHSS